MLRLFFSRSKRYTPNGFQRKYLSIHPSGFASVSFSMNGNAATYADVYVNSR